MNILAIDYGSKNIGLAWVQAGLDVVLPFGRISALSGTGKGRGGVEDVARVIKEEGVGLAVVGLPLGLDGKENENTRRVRSFARELRQAAGIPVKLFDERFTSQAADRLGQGGASRDEKAAMAILETYLGQEKRSGSGPDRL
ncbi:MAG: hypothetical protein UY92_C0009G0051 [Candidatus Magasanikbacteria bacterium GW2011_GWA2_56_11]|uniref:Putative pre-16S rRNA nuclease n=1 Tax=Candidatus Magasanikbacteria bacterium GW2011_GWA2_56_11 TaxID=1619044 RepID=A0A0G2ALR1_9BACT|nr:MAG: hypothetical protein UY92_C0009G0051 [Candidatus Magasanikbacteria bacterium GW2011_GWA2_56_11]